jgi:hypothetical protein
MASSTAWNCGLSPRWPAVTRIDSGLPLFAGQVRLGGQPAAGAAQGMVSGLGVHPARRLGLHIPFSAPQRRAGALWPRWSPR